MEKKTFGRTEENDVVIKDPFVSRRHMQITCLDDGTFRIKDIGSGNGTYVNGTKISGETVLKVTDNVQIGKSSISWGKYFGIEAPISIFELVSHHNSYKIGNLYYDSVELTDAYKAVEKEVDELAERMVKKKHGIEPGCTGFCVYFWSCKEKILKEKYGIEWRAPNTMNPRVMFD